jgi:uncharacterized linocin/CFP29 family protein
MAPNSSSSENAQVSEPRAFQGGGIPSAFLASGLNVNSLRTNALLRHEEWLELDRAVVDVARQTLVGIADLRQYGLVQPLGGLGTLLSGYEQMSDMTDANVDMSGVVPGEEDRDGFNMVSVPVPITHKDFRINIRTLEASRRLGDGLDVTQAQVATRKVSEMLESMLFNGSTIKVNANSIYGYTTHPSRNTGSATGDFGTISNIYSTVLAMMNALMQDGYYGPYGFYASPNQYADMLQVYSDGSGQSALQRILANLPQVKFIKPAIKLADGALVMPQLSRDVVDIAVAQDIVNVQWSEEGGMTSRFKVMAAMAPRIKSDAEGHSGIAHYTGA